MEPWNGHQNSSDIKNVYMLLCYIHSSLLQLFDTEKTPQCDQVKHFVHFFIDNKKAYKIYISTQNRDDSGEHTLYNHNQSLRYLQIYYKRQKEKREEMYVRLTG